MDGYHSSTIIGTITKDPTPICSVKTGDKPIGCDISVCVNQSSKDPATGKWVNYARYIKLTAWYTQATHLLNSKWCKKGYHGIFICSTTERAYTDQKDLTTKTLDYKILDARPILISASATNQQPQNTTQPTPSNQPSPHGMPAPQEQDEEIPF